MKVAKSNVHQLRPLIPDDAIADELRLWDGVGLDHIEIATGLEIHPAKAAYHIKRLGLDIKIGETWAGDKG
jgi:hypothetical protein